MTDAAQEQQAQLTPEQQYLQGLLNKFQTNPEDPELGDTEKVLASQIIEVQRSIVELNKQIEELNSEIRERQEKGNGLVQQVISKQGESQGYVNALLRLRK
jgi:peptidoglycan hydrolase CwlO-like protein